MTADITPITSLIVVCREYGAEGIGNSEMFLGGDDLRSLCDLAEQALTARSEQEVEPDTEPLEVSGHYGSPALDAWGKPIVPTPPADIPEVMSFEIINEIREYAGKWKRSEIIHVSAASLVDVCDAYQTQSAEITRLKAERDELSTANEVFRCAVDLGNSRIADLEQNLSEALEALRFYRDSWKLKRHPGGRSEPDRVPMPKLQEDGGQLARTILDKAKDTAP